jgi:spermidine synthase
MGNDRLQPRRNWSSAGRIAILSSVLFLSGIGSLIFETLWLRLSGLTFGNSIWSAALILSSFMAGMALGNAFAASSRVQRWRPLRLYAFLELVIAFLGCTLVFGLPLLGEWLRPVFQTLWNYQSILLGLRFVLSFLLLLLPATAMGLTLPVLMEDSFLQSAEFGRAIAFSMVSTPSEPLLVLCLAKLTWSRPLGFWEPLSQPARQHPLAQSQPC